MMVSYQGYQSQSIVSNFDEIISLPFSICLVGVGSNFVFNLDYKEHISQILNISIKRKVFLLRIMAMPEKEQFPFSICLEGIILRHEHLPKRSISDFFCKQTCRFKGKFQFFCLKSSQLKIVL